MDALRRGGGGVTQHAVVESSAGAQAHCPACGVTIGDNCELVASAFAHAATSPSCEPLLSALLDADAPRSNRIHADADAVQPVHFDLTASGDEDAQGVAAGSAAAAASLLDEDAAYARMVQASEEGGLLRPRRAASISSAPPALEDAEPELTEAEADGLVKAFEDHEQSVFAAAWSAADAWIFASLSLDGKAVINHVPPAEKYKILL